MYEYMYISIYAYMYIGVYVCVREQTGYFLCLQARTELFDTRNLTFQGRHTKTLPKISRSMHSAVDVCNNIYI